MVNPYVPERGDIIWINFDPVVGHEQGGKRPAIVLSPGAYHNHSPLLIACPITTKIKGYPFEVRLQVGKIDGVVLADQVKALDWRKRKVSFEGKATPSTVQVVLTRLKALLEN